MATERARVAVGDVWSGAVLGALGVYIVTQARQWDYMSPDGPGPGFFPMWYGMAIIVLSLGMVATRLLRTNGSGARGARVNWAEVGRGLWGWTAFATAAALLHVLGFSLTYALLSMFVVCVMYGRSLVSGIAVGVLGAAGFHLVFPVALDVALPVGLLGF
jgi:putative tricarboxylic transport membrane protein